MKGLVLALGAVAVGAVAGAVGVGSWNTFTAVPDSTVAEHADPPPAGSGTTAEASAPSGARGASAEPAHVDDEPPRDAESASTGERVAEGGDAPDEETTAQAEGSGGDPAGEAPAQVGRTTAPAEADPVPAPPDARTLENYQRLARIFAAMEPEEAAPVLSQLDDEQLEGILMAMQGRNAAPILAVMDPARVASISRRVLGGEQ